MKHTRLAAAAVLISGLTALGFSGVALAQDDEVIVKPPAYWVEHHRSFRAGDSVAVSEIVSAQDLDLRNDPDVDELYQRIDYTAHEVCRIAGDEVGTTSRDEDRQCVRDALRDAHRQADNLVDLARS